MTSKLSVVSTKSVVTTGTLVSHKYSSSIRNLKNSGADAHGLICSGRSSGTYFGPIEYHLEVHVVTLIWPHRSHELIESPDCRFKHSSKSVIGVSLVYDCGIIGNDLVWAQRVYCRRQSRLEYHRTMLIRAICSLEREINNHNNKNTFNLKVYK